MRQLPKHGTGAHSLLGGCPALDEWRSREMEMGNQVQPLEVNAVSRILPLVPQSTAIDREGMHTSLESWKACPPLPQAPQPRFYFYTQPLKTHP